MNMRQNLSVLGRPVKLGQWGKTNGTAKEELKSGTSSWIARFLPRNRTIQLDQHTGLGLKELLIKICLTQ